MITVLIVYMSITSMMAGAWIHERLNKDKE